MAGMFSSSGVTDVAGAAIPMIEISKHVQSDRLTRPTWVIAGRGRAARKLNAHEAKRISGSSTSHF